MLDRLFIGCFALLTLLAACSPDAERAAPELAGGRNVEVVRALTEAFNAHDPQGMRALWHDDVTWVEVTGDRSSVVTSSAEQLFDELVAYFETYPDVSSSLEDIVANGKYVSGIERPVWNEGGERKSQTSNVVYEIDDGRVKRFWYFPPQD